MRSRWLRRSCLVFASISLCFGSVLVAESGDLQQLKTALQDAKISVTKLTHWPDLKVNAGEAYRTDRAVIFSLGETKIDQAMIEFPRLNNQIERVFQLGVGGKGAIQFRQTPTRWRIDLKKVDWDTKPVVIAIEFKETPLLVAETKVVDPDKDGVILLPAHHASVHGEKLQYEPLPHKNTIGYWVNPKDWAEWKFSGAANQAYLVDVLQGCGKGQGGSVVQFTVAGQPLLYTVEDTGHFQNFQWRRVGSIRLTDKPVYGLSVRPQKLAKNAVMDIRAIRLTPAKVNGAVVTEPPPTIVKQFRLNDEYYRKYVGAAGVPIVASAKVHDEALLEAAYLMQHMLAGRDDIRDALIKNRVRFSVMAYNEWTTQVPEHSDLKPPEYWDRRARGLGATRSRPSVSCGEENLLRMPGDPYSTENILVHEFAHAMHHMGINSIDREFEPQLKAAYESAQQDGLWKGKYASTNRAEYWAEGVQSYFGTNRPPDHDHNHVDTREELKEYDPRLYALVDGVFRGNPWQYSNPETRTELPHLAELDRSTLPKFRWPERLNKAASDIRKTVEERVQKAKQSTNDDSR